ncbi:MAG: HlyD family efflux transporter periplasmic adaptor subunit [Planctomycetota bacterium]|nr:HlyD family efflux transporter periplasmic adaptor subunit [Planctomycetota bacterium]
MRRWLMWILIALVVAAGIWWFQRPRPVPIDAVHVTRGGVRHTLEEQGKTRVIERFVVSAPVAGRLLRVGLEEGDTVTEKQTIAVIDPLPLESRVQEIESQIRAIERRIDGVGTKKPKAQEIERARVLEQTASEALRVAEGERKELVALQKQADRELERLIPLAREKRVSPSELDDARTAATQAKQRVDAQDNRIRIRRLAISVARLERAVLEARLSDYDWEEKVYREQVGGLRASLRSITADLARTTIVAPAAGTVLAVHKESEQFVAAGTPIVDIADLERLEIEAEYLSEDAAHMRPGMKVEIFGRALGERVLEGELLRVEPSAFEKVSSLGVEQQRVRVIVKFDAKGTGLGDGFRVEVRVILDAKESVLRAPEGALFRQRDGWYAYKIVDDKARRVRVETGIRDGRSREILSGLDENDELVLYPADAVGNGTRIERLPPAEAQK